MTEKDLIFNPDIIGQEEAVRTLGRSLSSGRINHAYLFVGPAGVGRKRLALEFAKALNCRASFRPCGRCESCVKMRDSNHPDVKLIEPDGATLKIDQIRGLKKDLSYRPFEGRFRIFILPDCERLTEQAANSLLIALEEPPAETVFILISESEAHLLPTIVSRCQVIRLRRLKSGEIEAALIRLYGLSQERARALAALSGGAIGRAFLWVSDDTLLQLRERVISILEGIPGMDYLTILDFVESLEGSSRDEVETLLDVMVAWYRDLLIILGGGDAADLVNYDKGQSLRTLAQEWDFGALSEAVRAVEDTRRAIYGNANLRLALDALFLKLAGIRSPSSRLSHKGAV